VEDAVFNWLAVVAAVIGISIRELSRRLPQGAFGTQRAVAVASPETEGT
jgi:hypothetical protein